MEFKTELTPAPSSQDLDAILKPLTDYNESEVGPPDRLPLAILIRDQENKVIGGLSGYTSWGWLFTQLLFIPARLRGQGLAARLLDQAEAEARRRGCHGAWIDTFNPQALKTYQNQGYEVFGELPAFVKDRTRSFLKKAL